LKTNSPISPEDVKAGKCGGIIGRNDTKIKKGNYVYEFYDDKEHVSREEYKKHYPGFTKDTNSKGYCQPCCFKIWNTKAKKNLKNKCIATMEAKGAKKNVIPEERQNKEGQQPEAEGEPGKDERKNEEYIKGAEKFPLDKNRFGYLPINIEKILFQNNRDCQISNVNTNVKPNHKCLLRHGVEYSKNQSFIACIADLKYFIDSKSVLLIEEMKKQIIQSINLDSFITYQNGNLVTNFARKEDEQTMNVDIDIDIDSEIKKYKDSIIYSKLDIKKSSDMNYLKQIIYSFENFQKYLQDNEVLIDYTYLWDIISKPNDNLFPNGLNLIILEVVKKNNQVELICPVNHYQTNFYEARRPYVIIIKNEDFYEPVYSYLDNGKKLIISKTFSEYDKNLSVNLKIFLQKIAKPIMQEKCVPMKSVLSYHFKTPLLLDKLINILKIMKYKNFSQVLNFQNKVFGVVFVPVSGETTKEVSKIFIPCYPSSIDKNYPYILFNDNDENLFGDYVSTKNNLLKVFKESKGKIPCNPEFKVVQEQEQHNECIGFLTSDNQFVPIQPAIEISKLKDNNIPIYYSSDYINADIDISYMQKEDEERIETMKRLYLEKQFYSQFRNTVRTLLSDYTNLKIRENIEEEIKNPYLLYSNKLKNIQLYLKKVTKKHMSFSNKEYKNSELNLCLNLNKEKCEINKNHCHYSRNGFCELVLPKKNLINGGKNETIYFERLADEFIRYNRVRNYLLEPQSYLSFGKLNYKIYSDEIIIIQSLITQEYFEDMIPDIKNSYVSYISYDNADPLMSQVYENSVDLDLIELSKKEERKELIEETSECIAKIHIKISISSWRKCFRDDFKELEYHSNINCGFYFLMDIINKMREMKINSINHLKTELYNEYSKYFSLSEKSESKYDYEKKILAILMNEGKKEMVSQVKDGTIRFETMIYSDNYFISNFDMQLLFHKYAIPSFFLSSKKLKETNNVSNVFAIYGEKEDNFIFIISANIESQEMQQYKMILSNDHTIFIAINDNVKNDGDNDGDNDCKNILFNAIENKISLEEFIKKYKFIKEKPKKVKLNIILNANEPVKEYIGGKKTQKNRFSQMKNRSKRRK
jgi:hypothetical protein